MKSNICQIMLMIISVTICSASEPEFNYDYIHEISNNGILELKTDASEVRIVGSDRENVHLVAHRNIKLRGIHLSIDDNPFSFDVNNNDGNLYIESMIDSKVILGVATVYEDYFLIEVPQSINLDIYCDDGSISVENMANAMKLALNDGAVSVENCKSSDIDINMGDGTASVDNCKSSDVEINMGDGTASIDNSKNSDIEIEVGDGTAIINNCLSSQIRFEMGDGIAKLNNCSGDLKARLADGQIKIRNGSLSSIDAACSDGIIDIETSLSDSGEYIISANDGTINFNVLDGGGLIHVDFSDAIIKTGSHYKYVESHRNREVYSLKGGDAKIFLHIDDGSVSLK